MSFIPLPIFEKWPSERQQLSTQRDALLRKFQRGDLQWSDALDADAIVARRRLLELVKDGRIHPSAAKQEFELLNEGPLVPEPDPAKFDPMNETHWTVLITLAWIMWLDADDVRRHRDGWRAKQLVWRPHIERHEMMKEIIGQTLRPMSPTSYSELRYDELITQKNEGNPPSKSSEGAKPEHWRELEAENLDATGIDTSTNIRIGIPSHKFIDFNLNENDDGLFMSGVKTPTYMEVRLPLAKILDRWSKPSRRNASLANSERKCIAWLKVEMNAWLKEVKQSPKKPPAGRNTYSERAPENFPGLSKEGFGRAWRKAIDATGARAWSKPGRKAKSPVLKSSGQ
jgi:hypothetical protein